MVARRRSRRQITNNSFCALKPHAKFQNTRTTHSGRKITKVERKKEREGNTVNIGHLVLCSPRKPLGPFKQIRSVSLQQKGAAG